MSRRLSNRLHALGCRLPLNCFSRWFVLVLMNASTALLQSPPIVQIVLGCTLVSATAGAPAPAGFAKKAFSLPAGEAVITLKLFTAQSQVQLLYVADEIASVRTNAVTGEFTPRDAIQRQLAGTELTVVQTDGGSFAIKKATPTNGPPPTRPRPNVSAPSPESDASSISTSNRSNIQSSNKMKKNTSRALFSALIAFVLGPGTTANAADGIQVATGTVEGRVAASSTGSFLEHAQLRVESMATEAITDSGGFYRISGVPAGTIHLKVTYTGYTAQAVELTVVAGQTAVRDFALASITSQGADKDEVVKLNGFVVNTTRLVDGAALAINEQRYAPNIKNIVSTSEYTKDPEGNVAELMKFMPGISVENNGSNARWITMQGAPQDYVPVTIDGFNLASTGGDTTRRVGFDFVSINNLSRVEVETSPTPESQGEALAGSVNMVSRSAFEQSHPMLDMSVSLTMRDNALNLNKTPDSRDTMTRKIRPGFDFSYVAPVNKRFGFTLSGSMMRTYAGNENETGQTWRGTSAATNGAAFPDTAPDKPYLTSFYLQDGGKGASRQSIGTTLDFKASDRDKLTFTCFYSYNDLDFQQHRLTFNITQVQPGNFSPTFTHGAVGQGNLQMTTTGYNRINSTYMSTLVWRHVGVIWQAEGGASFSHAYNLTSDIPQGLFQATTAQRSGVTISFDDNGYLRPGSIVVKDGATGATIDPFGNLGNYVLSAATSGSPRTTDLQRSAYVNARRSFATRLPFSLKSGLDVRESVRDLSGGTIPYTFVGADGKSSTTPVGSDDSAAPYLSQNFSKTTTPNGWPNVQWTNASAILQQFQTNPQQFTSSTNTVFRNAVSNSKHAQEIITSGYIRGDLSLMEGRLKIVGGVRAEQTNVKAEGPLTDPSRNVQRDAQGKPVLNSAGQPVPITTDALATSQLTFITRGSKTQKEYLRLFPSVNATFSIKENLLLRAAYYESIGRPNLNQYAGGLTLPSTDTAPSTSNLIVVNNAAIKAWSAQTEKVRIEYYFQGIGQISLGAFQRDFKNFFGSTLFQPTSSFLTLYGLPDNPYSNYLASTQYNITSTVRTTGLEFDYKQALTFLPHWARGLQVFANGTVLRATGDAANNFFGYVPRTYSWGASLTRSRFNVRMNWNFRSNRRTGQAAAGSSVDPATYNWDRQKTTLDTAVEYQIANHLTLYVTARNINDAPVDSLVYGPLTPNNARFSHRGMYNSLWTVGVKSRF